ncbi:MAG: NADH-quinone oxidoreductase subunit L [Chitinophagales bacterium]
MITPLYIALFPLLGFLINAFLGKRLSKNVSGGIGSFSVLLSFLISASYFWGLASGNSQPFETKVFDWFSFGNFHIEFGFLIDQLSASWLMIITGIGFLIHVYSIGYMHDDDGFQRFFSYLNLFIFFMLLLVMGNNLVVMFIGWEGVGLCSYLLIGFWFKNQEYNNAAKKAFVMNRIGDLFFLIGMFLLLFYAKTLNYSGLSAAAGSLDHHVLFLATLFLFIGACGKSAQLPLYTWLPDAMAGPTPVSALIHAATMVTAGIFMICRTNFLFSLVPEVLHIIAIVGVATALFAATIGVLQNDIKKVLAYSTVSQLGLMFTALGLGAYSTGAFHVITHAFFKACLFLGSGSVIHAMHGQQDIRRMGGLKKWMPVTFITFMLASLAIAGVPPFSGFFSKDEILEHAFEHNKIIWAMASLASVLTAFYMFRLVFLTFFQNFRGTQEEEHHLHESPVTITFPLIVLAILSVVGGFIGLPKAFGFTHWFDQFLNQSPLFAGGNAALPITATEEGNGSVLIPVALAVAGAVIGIGYAYYKYIMNRQLPAEEGQLNGFAALVYAKYRIDELYNAVIVTPLMRISDLAYDVLDRVVVDGLVNLTGRISIQAGKQLRVIQSGNIGFYLLMMVVGIIAVFSYLLMRS